MENIIPFEFENNKIRTIIDKDGSTRFVAKDIAVALGYERPNDAITYHCKGASFYRPLNTKGGTQKARVISEPDVYRLIIKSKLPSAKRFERWVFEEVLPSIRKIGSYSIKPPKPQVFITGMLLKELRLLTDGQAQLMRNVGIDENQIVISTSRVMESVLGVNALTSIDIPTPNNTQYYTATALGGKLSIKLSGREINKRLTRMGFLLVEHEPSGAKRYVLTPKGKNNGGRVFDTGKKHSNGSIVQQIKWEERVLDTLKEADHA